MDLHLLGMAHSPIGPEFCRDPYGESMWALGKALMGEGHNVILYGAEGTDTRCCNEFVQCIGADTTQRIYGHADRARYMFDSGKGWTVADEAWTEFKMRAALELELRIRHTVPSVVLCSIGWAFEDWMARLSEKKHLVVEPMIGYGKTSAPFRVFTSKAWRHYTMAEDVANKRVNPGSPSKGDAVIPYPLDMDLFEFQQEKGDYALFIGRVIPAKGVLFAASACKKAGIPIKVVGQLPPEPDGANMRKQLDDLGAEWQQSVGPKERSNIIGKARMMVVPTIYCEPFGLVAAQAAACGTPCAVTTYGGLSETVVHGYTGYHCATEYDLVNALDQSGKIQPSLCRAWAEARFSCQSVGKLHTAYLKTITGVDAGLDWLHEPHPLEIIVALAQRKSSAAQGDPPASPAPENR